MKWLKQSYFFHSRELHNGFDSFEDLKNVPGLQKNFFDKFVKVHQIVLPGEEAWDLRKGAHGIEIKSPVHLIKPKVFHLPKPFNCFTLQTFFMLFLELEYFIMFKIEEMKHIKLQSTNLCYPTSHLINPYCPYSDI